jgi:hypothetical protein
MNVDIEETTNPDGSVDIVETVRDSVGQPQTNKYSVQAGNRPATIKQ